MKHQCTIFGNVKGNENFTIRSVCAVEVDG